ncbi:hypothetical protein ALC56_07813, partial [Trachymyrmex septentrionalis]
FVCDCLFLLVLRLWTQLLPAITVVGRAIRDGETRERESSSSLPRCPGTPVASERSRPTGLTSPRPGCERAAKGEMLTSV